MPFILYRLNGSVLKELRKTCGRTIDLTKQQIIFNGEVTQVRPKTFQLLCKFIQSPQQLITKQELLDSVWDDIEASDQVLFQTIRELRVLFDGEDVISTQPRKGYVWIAPVSSIVEVSNNTLSSSWKFTFKIFAAAITLLTFFFLYFSYKPIDKRLDGSLVILPVKSEMADNIHNWVYLGAMDQLISHFSSDESFTVMSPEDVLQIMKEADIREGYSSEQLSRVFNVSGANLIVESTLSGFIKDYQLKYNLYFREGIKRGIVFDNTVNGAIEKLAALVSKYTGHNIHEVSDSYKSDFSNELLVRAIEKKELYEYKASNEILATLLIEDEDNIVAHRTMAANLIALRKLDEAEKFLNDALKLTMKLKPEELPVIYYNQAVIHYIRGDFEKAIKQLTIADRVAQENNDWLYRAYSNELRGKIYIYSGEFELAQSTIKQAMSQYSIIQCPVGTSQSLMTLSYVAKLSGNNTLALDYLQQASEIIEKRELTFLANELTTIKEKVL